MRFIKRPVLTMNKKMDIDPVLLECCKKLFEFANKIGLKGVTVKDLELTEEKFDDGDWVPYMFICEQEVKEEENS